MALQISFEIAGISLPEAYARVKKFIVENPISGGANVSFDLEIYVNQKTRDAGKIPIWGPQGHTFMLGMAPVEGEEQLCYLDKLPGDVVLADAYNYLKTLGQFKEATDV